MPALFEPWALAAWLAVGAPLLGIGGLIVFWRARAPQLRLGGALAALKDRGDSGAPVPLLTNALSAAASVGAAGALGAASAVALGGAGSLFWVWVFGFLIAGLRTVETLLARTRPPGRADGTEPGSLACRLREGTERTRRFGWPMTVLVIAASLFLGGALQGDALDRFLQAAGYEETAALVASAAGLAALTLFFDPRRTASIAGWLAILGLAILTCVAFVVAGADPGRALAVVPRIILEALEGAPSIAPHSGASAGEVLGAAVAHLLPWLAGTLGMAGSIHGLGNAPARKQAAAAILDPLTHTLVLTLVGIAIVATGAFFRPTELRLPLSEVTFYRVGFETTSQREETDRLFMGYARITGGEAKMQTVEVTTDRAVIENPRFEYYGRPADIALRMKDGRAAQMLRPKEGALVGVPEAQLAHVVVTGTGLTTDAALLALTAAQRGRWTSQLLAVALFVLAACAAVAWGLGARQAVRPRSKFAGVALALLPAAAMAFHDRLTDLGGLAGLGLGIAAVLFVLAALTIVWNSSVARTP